MRARLSLALACVALACVTALAQPPAPSPSPSTARPGRPAPTPRPTPPAQADQTPPAPPPPPPVASSGSRRGQPVNIKVEFTLTDQRGTSAPIKRTVSVIVADAHTGMIRSQAEVAQVGTVPLNIDTSPELLSDGKIRLGFNVQYDWPAPIEAQSGDPGAGIPMPGTIPRGTVYRTSLHDSVSLILESGKPIIAAQSADPIGDRQVTVEVKATVLK